MADQSCLICSKPLTPDDRHVHAGCRDRIRGQLADLPRKLAALTLQLVPGLAPAGDRVSTTRVGSPTGARLDVLSLTGPGSTHIADYGGLLGYQMIRWREIEHAKVRAVIVVDPPEPADPDRPGRARRRFPIARTVEVVQDVVTWHAEVELDDAGDPYTVAGDDQVGSLPPAEWADSWARMWQQLTGYSPTSVHWSWAKGGGKSTAMVTAAAAHLDVAWLAGGPAGRAAVSALGVLHHTVRQHAADLTAGRVDGLNGRRQYDGDPLLADWTLRFGNTVRVPAAAPVRYLLRWLDHACDDPDDRFAVADLAAELRIVTAELARVLGERDDKVWIGRCPALITNLTSGETRRCGGHLWEDPYVGTVYVDGQPVGVRIQCPRCRTAWGPRRYELLVLAQEIRAAWPVDRTRRYTAAEIANLVMPACPSCGRPVHIGWRDVTSTRDTRPRWRPVTAGCPAGCPDAQKVI